MGTVTLFAQEGASGDAGGAAVGGVLLLVMIGFGLLFYFAPTVMAVVRGHPNVAPIIVLNFFLGWTLVGWVVALAWAFTNQENPRHVHTHARTRARPPGPH